MNGDIYSNTITAEIIPEHVSGEAVVNAVVSGSIVDGEIQVFGIEGIVTANAILGEATVDRVNIARSVIHVNTTEAWNRDISYVPAKGEIIVYSDRFQIEESGVVKNVPGVKIGDGNAYLIDLPFITDAASELIIDHINDTALHVTPEEKEFWNNKINCAIDGEVLILNRF